MSFVDSSDWRLLIPFIRSAFFIGINFANGTSRKLSKMCQTEWKIKFPQSVAVKEINGNFFSTNIHRTKEQKFYWIISQLILSYGDVSEHRCCRNGCRRGVRHHSRKLSLCVDTNQRSNVFCMPHTRVDSSNKKRSKIGFRIALIERHFRKDFKTIGYWKTCDFFALCSFNRRLLAFELHYNFYHWFFFHADTV